MKIRINDLNLRSKPRNADGIVAGVEADKTLQIDFEIDIPGDEKPEDRLEDILQAVRRVTLEAMKTKKLIPEDTGSGISNTFTRW